VATSKCKINHFLDFEGALHLVWTLLTYAAITMKTPTQLAKVVVPPRVQLALLGKNAHVLVTSTNSFQLETFDAHLTLCFKAIAPTVGEKTRKI
jgi:hypothetical protein